MSRNGSSVVYERVLRETGKLVRVTQNGRKENDLQRVTRIMMTEHEAETKMLKMAAWILKEKCDGTQEHCECCPFSLWYDAGAGCLFGKLTPAEWDLYLIADRKTWPEDE